MIETHAIKKDGQVNQGASTASVSRDVTTAKVPLSRVYSIGWALSDRSISKKDSRFVCTVVAYEEIAQLHGEQAAETSKILDKKFIVEIRPNLRQPRTDDVSGVLGLLSPWGSAEDRKAHDHLERSLADVQLWALYACIAKAKQAAGRCVILIQGPLLPKVRGRVLYRMFDVERYSLYVVTSEPRWVGRLMKGSGLHNWRERVCPQGAGSDQSSMPQWSLPAPDLGLDASIREFVGGPLGKDEVHVAVPANCLPARSASRFWTQCTEDLQEFFKSAKPLDAHGGAMLPRTLCDAIKDAGKSQEEFIMALAGAVTAPTQDTSRPSAVPVSEITNALVQNDLYGEPVEVTKAIPPVDDAVPWVWVAEFLEVPSQAQLDEFDDQDAAKRIFQESRANLIDALKEMPKTDRTRGSKVSRRWQAYLASHLAKKKAGRKKTKKAPPELRSMEHWRTDLSREEEYREKE